MRPIKVRLSPRDAINSEHFVNLILKNLDNYNIIEYQSNAYYILEHEPTQLMIIKSSELITIIDSGANEISFHLTHVGMSGELSKAIDLKVNNMSQETYNDILDMLDIQKKSNLTSETAEILSNELASILEKSIIKE